MSSSYLSIEKLYAYSISFELSNYVWATVVSWKYFERDTLGKQYVRAIDSISANIAEGFGRFSKKDKIRFYYYSLGSVSECKDWNNKCFERSIISKDQHKYIQTRLDLLPKEIFLLIRYTNEKLKH